MLAIDIQGVTMKPAAEGDPSAFHYHALIDVDPATVLQPGQHTVVVLTRTDHVPLSPNVQDRVTFTVAAPGTGGAQAPPSQAVAPTAGQTPMAAPRVGTGGPLGADGEPPVVITLGLVGVLLAGAGAAARYARRGGRAAR